MKFHRTYTLFNIVPNSRSTVLLNSEICTRCRQRAMIHGGSLLSPTVSYSCAEKQFPGKISRELTTTCFAGILNACG